MLGDSYFMSKINLNQGNLYKIKNQLKHCIFISNIMLTG